MQIRRRFQAKMAFGALIACAVGVACQNWDLEISGFVRTVKIPGDFRKAISLSESFAHASGGIVIFATLLWIDFKNRPKLLQAALFTLICGIAANAAKIMVPRYRPHSLDLSDVEIASSWQTWGVPWTGSWFEEQLRSFPSGHSATAVAFAIGLTQVYPRGKWIFASMAALACLQRLESSAHFLSDIMGGVVISLVLSLWYWKDSNCSKSQHDCELQESIPHPPLLNTE